MYIKPKMLFFGSPACDKCVRYKVALSKEIDLNVNNFTFINGDDLENAEVQKFCDQHNVDEYPHVKIYVLNKCIHEEVGDLNIQKIVGHMRKTVEVKDASKYTTSQSDKPQ